MVDGAAAVFFGQMADLGEAVGVAGFLVDELGGVGGGKSAHEGAGGSGPEEVVQFNQEVAVGEGRDSGGVQQVEFGAFAVGEDKG